MGADKRTRLIPINLHLLFSLAATRRPPAVGSHGFIIMSQTCRIRRPEIMRAPVGTAVLGPPATAARVCFLTRALRWIVAILILASGPAELTGCRKSQSPADLAAGKPSALEGKPAPQFTLASNKGPDVSLLDFAGKSKVVLVFYRGYW
jgi:hypothetical protein